jgi:hypothetical protein
MKAPGVHFISIAVCVVSASAQATGRGATGSTVGGTVFDSIGGSALRGASVQVVGAADAVMGRRFTAVTDSLGRYTISEVPPGRYLVGFQHPRLDSLGLEIEDRAITVGDANVRLDLTTPSPATYLALVCPDQPSAGLLVGHVRQTGSQTPLPNASVFATWTELDTTNVFVAQRSQERSIRTAPSGWFGLCGLPGDVAFLARAASGADSSGYVRVSLPSGAVRVATFHVGGAERAETVTDATPEIQWRGEAQLSGTVNDKFGKPLSAHVTVWGTDTGTTTDGRGRFRLSGLPGGTQTVEVRAIGFQPIERVVALSAGDPTTVDILLRDRVRALEGVNVTAMATRARLKPFYDRMRDADRGINRGYFITEEEIERRKPAFLTSLFYNLPTVNVLRGMSPLDDIVIGSRRCKMTIYLDNIRLFGTLHGAEGTEGGINRLVPPSHVAAVEVYPNAVNAPPDYQLLNGTCGIILIWTK